MKLQFIATIMLQAALGLVVTPTLAQSAVTPTDAIIYQHSFDEEKGSHFWDWAKGGCIANNGRLGLFFGGDQLNFRYYASDVDYHYPQCKKF